MQTNILKIHALIFENNPVTLEFSGSATENNVIENFLQNI